MKRQQLLQMYKEPVSAMLAKLNPQGMRPGVTQLQADSSAVRNVR